VRRCRSALRSQSSISGSCVDPRVQTMRAGEEILTRLTAHAARPFAHEALQPQKWPGLASRSRPGARRRIFGGLLGLVELGARVDGPDPRRARRGGDDRAPASTKPWHDGHLTALRRQLDRLLLMKKCPTDLRNRLHDQHPKQSLQFPPEAYVTPLSEGARLDADHHAGAHSNPSFVCIDSAKLRLIASVWIDALRTPIMACL
jgi:hypothetical protein